MSRSQTTDATRRLDQAVLCGNIEVVEETLRDGGCPDLALGAAAALGHSDIVDLLLGAGASIAARDCGSIAGETPLYLTAGCGSPAIAQRLIDAGADVNAPTDEQHTPLHFFAQEGHTAGVRVLLGAGAEIEAVNNYSDTPLTKAVRWKRASTVALLLEAGANQEWRDKQGWQAIHLAAQAGDVGVAGLLIQAGADVNTTTSGTGYTPLLIAVHNSHTTLIGFLLRAGARVSIPDANLITPLHLAAMKKSTSVVVEILAFLEEQDDDMVGLRAALSLEGPKGRTPLHDAIGFGRLRIVNTLLRYGAVETRRDSVGKTPSLYPREWLAAAGATVEGDVSRNQSEMKAIVRSLRRGPAFRARSFLWPRAVVEVRGRPSWKVYPFDVRRSGQKRKRFVIMATLSRYTKKG